MLTAMSAHGMASAWPLPSWWHGLTEFVAHVALVALTVAVTGLLIELVIRIAVTGRLPGRARSSDTSTSSTSVREGQDQQPTAGGNHG